MMNSILFGRGYWGGIVKEIIREETNLLFVVDSRTDLSALDVHDVDIAFVCSSTSSHYDVVKWCIDNGINIFCEKPFTGEYKKAKELYKMAEKGHVNIFVDNIFLYRNEIKDLGMRDMYTSWFLWDKTDTINPTQTGLNLCS